MKSKRVYKEGEPFNGNFDERVGGVFVNQNYLNGVKEGEQIGKLFITHCTENHSINENNKTLLSAQVKK